jgi:hypothetical protein
MVGTEGDDTLVGTNRHDVIVGLSGDDTIEGLRTGDIICGGLSPANASSPVMDRDCPRCRSL